MCGRYTLTTRGFTEHYKKHYKEHYGVEQGAPKFGPPHTIASTQTVPLVLTLSGERAVTPARRGSTPFWTKDLSQIKALFNARLKTAYEEAGFRGPLRYRRALVPASGFYECKREGGRKTPYYLTLAGDEPSGSAGLHNYKDELLSCTVLRTSPNSSPKNSPNELMSKRRDRLPVSLSPGDLSPDDFERWLDPGVTDPDEVHDLLRPYAGVMRACAASSTVPSTVNTARNDGPVVGAA